MRKSGPYPRGGPATEATMHELRVAIRLALRDVSMADAVKLTKVSENTITRIVHHGANVSIRTAARIAEGLGYRLRIKLSENTQHIAVLD
jgi:transcriptional regulator with XRE-family HTH domain